MTITARINDMGISFKVKKMKFTVAYRLPHSRNRLLAERAITQYIVYTVQVIYISFQIIYIYILSINLKTRHNRMLFKCWRSGRGKIKTMKKFAQESHQHLTPLVHNYVYKKKFCHCVCRKVIHNSIDKLN